MWLKGRGKLIKSAEEGKNSIIIGSEILIERGSEQEGLV